MRVHLQRDIEKLKRRLLVLSTEVEEDVRLAIRALAERNETLAREVVAREVQTNTMEVDIEEDCLKILALHQPVARDLRLIVSIIKINTELERIADIAVNIAKRIVTIRKKRPDGFSTLVDYQPMATRVLAMVKTSLDALVTEDAALARQIFLMDEEVNRLRDQAYRTIIHEIDEVGGGAACLINLYLIARHLERIGDRSCNIGEEVIYLVEGEIVRTSEDAV